MGGGLELPTGPSKVFNDYSKLLDLLRSFLEITVIVFLARVRLNLLYLLFIRSFLFIVFIQYNHFREHSSFFDVVCNMNSVTFVHHLKTSKPSCI